MERFRGPVLTLADKASTERRFLVGASLSRIVLGSVVLLYFYCIHYAERQYFFGPSGVWPWTNFQSALAESGSFSLYGLSESRWLFEVVFHAGLLVAVLFVFGYRARLMAVLHYIFTWSLFQRNPALLDGGDNVMYLVLAYFICIDSSSVISLDARRRRRLGQGSGDNAGSTRQRLITLLHHAGVAAVVIQVCIVYVASSLYKLQGERWQEGTALYYILRTPEFSWPSVSPLVYESALLVTIGTYVTVLFQLAFPFMLLTRWTRLAGLACALAFHSGIALMMGLGSFAFTMIGAELMCISDKEYGSGVRWIRRRVFPGAVGAEAGGVSEVTLGP